MTDNPQPEQALTSEQAALINQIEKRYAKECEIQERDHRDRLLVLWDDYRERMKEAGLEAYIKPERP